MARKKSNKAAPLTYHCGMCEDSFRTRGELSDHTKNHPDNTPNKSACQCGWKFTDSYALERHLVQTGHSALANNELPAERSNKNAKPSKKVSTAAITCDRCPDTFRSQKEYAAHRSFPAGRCADHKHKRIPPKPSQALPKDYVDLDAPTQDINGLLGYDNASESSEGPSTMSIGDDYCSTCKRIFKSKASYNSHQFGCVEMNSNVNSTPVVPHPQAPHPYVPSVTTQSRGARQASSSVAQPPYVLTIQVTAPQYPRSLAEASHPMPLQNITMRTRQPVPHQQPVQAPSRPQPHPSAITPSPSANAPAVVPVEHACNIGGCNKICRSEHGLRVHQQDVHGVGGQQLDFYGHDSWMLGQRERERLRVEGLLRDPSASSRGGGRGRGRGGFTPPPRLTPTPAARSSLAPGARGSQMPVVRAVPTPVARPFNQPSAPQNHVPHHVPVQRVQMLMPASMPVSGQIGGAAEMEQAKLIHGKILRLLIQSDISIKHDGKMTVSGINWTRIGVSNQPSVIESFDAMCHLPKSLQGEYLPPPKAFKDDYKAQYPVINFKPSPARDVADPGLGVVAIWCSKVVLADGLQEVVKVAAIDVVTCRILLNHLVCTDPHAKVNDWRPSLTGLSSWRDVEGARQAGYKVLKGWTAARSALWKFIDKDTILVGHNLRSDLDALRMIHGRAVDVAKVVEKAAKGPLTRAQLGLDSLCRDYTSTHLKSDPEYGRDALMNAFAAREFCLWTIKNKEKLDKGAKQKSLDYQKIMPKGVSA